MKKETKEIYICDRCGKEFDGTYLDSMPIKMDAGTWCFDYADLCEDCQKEFNEKYMQMFNEIWVKSVREFCGLNPNTEDYFPHKQPPKMTLDEVIKMTCESSHPTRY